jgi:heptose-I-phosphate ethanolaminephosphotransferase
LKEISKLYQRPSLTKIFRGAGFKTLYVTTRPKYLFPNIVSTFQDDAEDVEYLSTLKRKVYDEAAIPVIRGFLNRNKKRKRFVILHLMGSHIEYSMQYPRKNAFFHSGDKMLDTYNDSVRYSDGVIMKAVDLVMNSPEPGFVLYASDHGENLDDFADGNYGHGTRGFTRFEFEIPFEVFFNDAFLKHHPDEASNLRKRAKLPISQDNISHTFLGLAGIVDPELYRPEENLASSKFKLRKRFVIDENMNVYNFDDLRLDKRKVKRKR